MHPECPRTASPPDCLDDDLVAGFVDGGLDAPTRSKVMRLMDQCAVCRRQVSEVMKARSTMGAGTPAPSSEAPATIGRYQVRGVLGKGGMGVVLRAWDPELEREVAVKLVRGETADGAQRLAREARAMAKVRHPGVLAVFDAGVVDGEVFVVMEVIDGETLADWYARTPPWRDALARCRAAGEGLAAAHDAGLVHRDFKPANVLCATDGRVLVADFGLARGAPGVSEAPSALTTTGGVVGTPAYMAPEQHLGEKVGPAADQFALAATIYEGLYGRRPFAGNTLAALISEVLSGKLQPPPGASDVPRAVHAVIERGMARDPAARWPSVRAMLDALASPPAPARRAATWLPIAIGGAIAVGGIALGLGLHGGSPAAPAAPAATPAPAPSPDAMPTPPDARAATQAVFSGVFPADRLGHWDMLRDRPVIDARARAWAPDAELMLMTAIGVDADGVVDIHAGGFLQYGYLSRSIGDSKDLRTIGRCTFIAYVKETQQYADVSSNSDCGKLRGTGEPRCTFGEIWRRAKADGADPTLPAKIEFARMPPKDLVEWLFQSVGGKQAFTRVYPDDC